MDLRAKLDAVASRFNDREPELGAFLPEPARFERLHNEAEALAARWPDPGCRPPLFGALLGVKDILRVDGHAIRAGSRLPIELFRGPEASCVTHLRAAGALILGITVSTEFAYLQPAATRNPRRGEHTPGGSSSGSAAAVGAGLADLALGSQTVGSTLRPAAYCGIAGFKPSYDRINRDGMIALAAAVDHVGLLAPNVATLEHAAAATCRAWRRVDAPRRPRLAIPIGPYLDPVEPAARQAFESVCARLRESGFSLSAVPALADVSAIGARHRLICAVGAAQTHARWYAAHRADYGAQMAELIELGRTIDTATYAEALRGRVLLRAELERLRHTHDFDLWLAPGATGPAPATRARTGDPALNFVWTHAGVPVVGLPAGAVDGLPVGIQLIGSWWNDEFLLASARDVERQLRAG